MEVTTSSSRMSPIPSYQLEEIYKVLETVLSDGSPVVTDVKLAGLLNAAWMRLKTWESDIRNKEEHTLSRLSSISYPTAEIVRYRLQTVLEAVERVRETETGATEYLRDSVGEVFRAATNVSRTTPSLRALFHVDPLSIEIAAVAASRRQVDAPVTSENASTAENVSGKRKASDLIQHKPPSKDTVSWSWDSGQPGGLVQKKVLEMQGNKHGYEQRYKQGYAIGAKVKTKVTEGSITQMKPLVIADAMNGNDQGRGGWQYQLASDKVLQDGGRWFPEVDIRPRKE